MSKEFDELLDSYDNHLVCYGIGCASAGKNSEEDFNVEPNQFDREALTDYVTRLESELARLRDERRWKNVERDGFPEPNEEKTYNVLYPTGSGIGAYNIDYNNNSRNRWYCDFDTVGHEDEITDYLEIHYPDEPPEAE